MARFPRFCLLSYCLYGVFAACLVGCSDASEDEPTVAPGGVVIVAPATVDPALERLALPMLKYLGKLGAPGPKLVRLASGSSLTPQKLGARMRAGLVVVLDAHTLAPSLVPASATDKLGTDGFRITTKDVGDWPNKLGSRGATMVYTAAKGKLGKQYTVWEVLRRLGARFYHPEEEYLPKNDPKVLRQRAKTPTAVARKDKNGVISEDYTPDFGYRSYSFHGSHPLEHIEAFSDGSHAIDEAVHVNDWAVKNRANGGKGATRGVSTQANYDKRKAELTKLTQTMGFPSGAGITLHNQQQGSSAVVDPKSSVPPQKQIEDYVEKRLTAAPNAYRFGIHFGPTEFTTTPDKQTVDWINWAGRKALALRPDIRIEVNNHTTGSQAVQNFSDLGCPPGTNTKKVCDYYDLAFHTDKRFGIKVHTVMFYPLEGPAPVYNQKSFAHKLCLIKKASADGRPMTWFPEGSWWLSFDNPIPVYLPLYIWTRGRDIELLKPLLKSRGGGTVMDHRMFNSGQAWGYWQQDYAVGMWHWNADVTLEQVYDELFDPMCEPSEYKTGCAAKREAIAVIKALIEHQRAIFLAKKDVLGREGGLFAYFSGEDPADEIAAATGLEFQPVKVSFSVVARWSKKQIDAFKAGDLTVLLASEKTHKALTDRLKKLTATVPTAGKSWLAEFLDGVEINYLRARQTFQLYSAVVAYREAQLASAADPKAAASATFALATKTLAEAEAVIRRREKAYRYPGKQMYGGGLTKDTAVANGTTYPYRVHTKTHLLTYWKNRHEDVKAVLAGKLDDNTLNLSPGFAAPGSALKLSWPNKAGLAASATIGGKAVTDKDSTLDLGRDEGFFAVAGKITLSGKDIPLSGGVVRAKVLGKTPKKGLTLKKPDSILAQTVLNPLFPPFRWAVWGGSKAGVAMAPDIDGDGDGDYAHAVSGTLSAAPTSTFSATVPGSFKLPIPNPGGGGKSLMVTLSQVTIAGKLASGKLASPVTLSGKMKLEDLVQALIDLAGFDRKGALATLATVLKFDTTKPPETFDFSGDLKVE